ncbi:HAMP domain-containing histidine kinase [Paraburkholderia sprentiae WSM5005]|uniref:histidine kinase n=1 Tax=Paraburkholderia sprentiae WSM5005 TaxID=754502 RepID=A0A1I9YNK4_9BURK|nr:HAMP domain-containing sensor histidine kinase [Paraburkholderia sprentiae]APA87887.1 HAMP domain-containing histidine kinase [Paraburkholderia sprentiae WSM5005]
MTTSPTGTAGAPPASAGFVISERSALLRAETALFLRDHVLSLVSHDLRGPLNAIHSWAYVLERKLDANDPNSQRAITGIRSGVDQQVKLLETIVDATRAETKSLALTYEPFPLHPLLDETVEEVRTGLARARGVDVRLDSQLATEQLNGDRARLAAALWLMLMFAAEASARGAEVALAARVDNGTWQARVSYEPNHAALNDAALPHVLEAFARKQACEPREAKRIAWVFALSKRVAEAHGGSFEQSDATGAESDTATPATLVLRVPLSAATPK